MILFLLEAPCGSHLASSRRKVQKRRTPLGDGYFKSALTTILIILWYNTEAAGLVPKKEPTTCPNNIHIELMMVSVATQ